VADELKVKCGVDAQVIYYPAKKVSHTGVKKYPFRVMMVGRLGDANKRAGTAVQALIRAGFEESEVAIVGPEYLGYGTRMGTVTDETLSDLYNSIDYVFMLSRNEGIGLPAIEAALAGAIPIVAPDLTTFNEFWAQSPLGLHYQRFTSAHDIAQLILSIEADPTWKSQLKLDILAYAETHFRPKFDRTEVAKRIISVYQSISP
jgi:glycosyltransferase involved in cell wall biosynthesis